MGNSNLLFESIFNRDFSAIDNADYLNQLTIDHPYFSPAHFFLLLQTKRDSDTYVQIAAQTALHFNNTYLLQFQLLENANPIIETENIVDKLENANPIHQNELIPIEANETIVVQNDSTLVLVEDGIIEQSISDVLPENELEPIIDNKIAANTSEININAVHFNKDNLPLINEEEIEEDEDFDKEIIPLNFKLNIDTSQTTEDTITFEPLHISDYFASLGIKLNGDIKPSDKLGKQLKSFTDWLKTMKKIHTDEIPAQIDNTEIFIQTLAEKSNTQGEVLTEAMADVLVQQGKAKSAVEVYKKLSLLNPTKSTFFAAKIDQLKEH